MFTGPQIVVSRPDLPDSNDDMTARKDRPHASPCSAGVAVAERRVDSFDPDSGHGVAWS